MPSSKTWKSSFRTLSMGRLLRSITRTFNVTNSVLILIKLSGSISSGGVGVGFGLNFGGGGASPSVGRTRSLDVVGVGVGVWAARLGVCAELTGAGVGAGVWIDLAVVVWVVRRGRPSGVWAELNGETGNSANAPASTARSGKIRRATAYSL